MGRLPDMFRVNIMMSKVKKCFEASLGLARPIANAIEPMTWMTNHLSGGDEGELGSKVQLINYAPLCKDTCVGNTSFRD